MPWEHACACAATCSLELLPQTDCKNETSWLYPYTMHGLDRMMQKYFELGQTIPQYQFAVRAHGSLHAPHAWRCLGQCYALMAASNLLY